MIKVHDQSSIAMPTQLSVDCGLKIS